MNQSCTHGAARSMTEDSAQMEDFMQVRSAKEKAKEVIAGLPDDASLDRIMEALYVFAKFERGESEVRQGRGLSRREAEKRLRGEG